MIGEGIIVGTIPLLYAISSRLERRVVDSPFDALMPGRFAFSWASPWHAVSHFWNMGPAVGSWEIMPAAAWRIGRVTRLAGEECED
jgi:hypothetical protein